MARNDPPPEAFEGLAEWAALAVQCNDQDLEALRAGLRRDVRQKPTAAARKLARARLAAIAKAAKLAGRKKGTK